MWKGKGSQQLGGCDLRGQAQAEVAQRMRGHPGQNSTAASRLHKATAAALSPSGQPHSRFVAIWTATQPHLPQVALVRGRDHHWHLIVQLFLESHRRQTYKSSESNHCHSMPSSASQCICYCLHASMLNSQVLAEQMGAHHNAQRLGMAAAVDVPLVPVAAPHALLLRRCAPERPKRNQLLRCAARGT